MLPGMMLQPGLMARRILTLKTIVLSAGTTSWTVPADWNSANNTIEFIGSGGNGAGPGGGCHGGGGGAYARSINLAYTAGHVITCSVPAGNGGGAWLNNDADSAAAVRADGASGTAGGLVANCLYNDVAFAGGDGGGTADNLDGGGGGGAGGPNGAGLAGGNASNPNGGDGGAGDNGFGGAGGTHGTSGSGPNATVGGDGTEIDATNAIGSGGGGGGGGRFANGNNAANGGKYGGGGGATGPIGGSVPGSGSEAVGRITYWS